MPDRRALRLHLHQRRDAFVAQSGATASPALAEHLGEVIAQLLPERLGLYWPLRSEFNAALACLGDRNLDSVPFALPYALKASREMQYRAWDRDEPPLRDECGIPSTEGPQMVPDVVLVPCLGYTSTGYRLGYGGGYYDRWLAAHPHVTAVGVAWSACELSEAELAPQPHDHPLMIVVTERGVAGA